MNTLVKSRTIGSVRRALAFAAVSAVLCATKAVMAQAAPNGPSENVPAQAPPADPRDRPASNALYAEVLGPALLYSINYEHAFSDVAARVGFEYLSLGTTNADGSTASVSFVGVPITVSYLGFGSHTHVFEVGAGMSIWYFGGSVNTLGSTTSGSAVGVAGTILAGYRYQPPTGGFMFRAGMSPLVASTGAVLPWPYLGLGWAF